MGENAMDTAKPERGMRNSDSSCSASFGRRSRRARLGGVGVGACVGGGGISVAGGAARGEGLGSTVAAGAGGAVGEGAGVLHAATRSIPTSRPAVGCLQPPWIWLLLVVGSWYIMSLVRRSCDI